MNRQKFPDEILRLLPILLYAVALLGFLLLIGIEFVLEMVGNRLWINRFNRLDANVGTWLGYLALFSFGLSWLWCLVIYLFPVKKHWEIRWVWSLTYFIFPALGIFIILSLPPASEQKEVTKKFQCLSNTKQLAIALQLYAIDNNDYFPEKLDALVPDHVPEKEQKKLFRCPAEKDPEVLKSYNYFGKGRKITDPVFVILQEKSGNHPDGFFHQIKSDGEVSYKKFGAENNNL